MKKYFTSLNIIFAIEALVVILASLGIIPREAVLFLTGLVVFYMIFSPVSDSLYLTIMSIPLFVALPFTETFDSMAGWRILIAALFLCLFFKQGISINLIKDSQGKFRLKENLKHNILEKYLAPLFLLISLFSIFIADYQVLGIKKLLFLINAFLLFLVIRNLAKSKEAIIKIFQAMSFAALVVIAVALIQFLVVLFVPLFAFWQFWTEKVISVFYGQNLSDLLSYSNTWFAYYSVNPPTLRLFSVFPDSHSLAMFLILSVPVFLSLAVYYNQNKRKKIFFWIATGLSLAIIILTGSRGAWLSILPVAGVAIYLFVKRLDRALVKKSLITFLIFGILFLASSFYPPVLYKFQSWQDSGNASTTFSFFERARSISRLSEISNKGRLEIWQASIESLIKYPILGVGLGNYVKVLDEDPSAAKKGASAHNLYLDFANEIGIFGALVLILMFLYILWISWLVFRRSGEPHFKIFGLFFGLYFLWVMAYSLFDVVLLNDKVLLLFLAECGVLFSIAGLIKIGAPKKD
ncbi:MAG: O-antigen ligase family protein [Candidatus Portnoybacteria bacterium]|nr:O-antigen ligase family protein [Candidatus Portnoybacteria bacterium]